MVVLYPTLKAACAVFACLYVNLGASLMLMERRRGTRHPVHLDCSVSPHSKSTASLSGQTVNMSNCGVLVSLNANGPLPTMLEVGQRARVLLELPHVPYFRGCWLDCKCEVARVIEENDAHLVGLHVSHCQFRPALHDSLPVP